MIVELFETYFWETAEASVSIIVPVLGLFLFFRLLHDLLFKDRL